MTKDKVTRTNFKEWNEEMARKYDPDAFHHHPSRLVRYIERKRVRQVLEFLNCRADEVILEVGCGAGNIMEQIIMEQMMSVRLIGIDISNNLLIKAKRRLGAMQKIVQADAECLPFPAHSFDKVYCSEVLEHVIDPGRVLEEMRRVLKGEGIAVISIPNEQLINKIKLILNKTRAFHLSLSAGKPGGYTSPIRMDDEWHIHSFDLSFAAKLLKPHFVVHQLAGIPVNFFPLRYVLKCKVRLG